MRTRPSLPLTLVVALALAGCSSPSPSEIQGRLGGLPGVVSATAGSVGDDDLPFGHGAIYVSVEMADDATADQVLGVLDLLDEEFDEEGLETVEVRIPGPKVATLTTGDVHDRERLAGDLVAAYGDREVLSYDNSGWYLSVHVATEDFEHVVAAADRYGDAEDPDEATVVAGKFRLDRVRGDDPVLLDARTRFVQRVEREFPLTGAVVSGHGPLELWTTWKRRDALRALVAKDPEAQGLGPVVVRTASIPWS